MTLSITLVSAMLLATPAFPIPAMAAIPAI
jgi:hypothetical protein